VSNDRRQLWWPESPILPALQNAPERKRLYQRFWAMMTNNGAWNDPRYITKKSIARKSKTTWHRRELMPDCILKKCRQWLPNPVNVAYMGHKWK